MSVSEYFQIFCSNLTVPTDVRSNISYRYKRITRQMNVDIWNIDSDTFYSRYVGSYGRGTAIGAISDIDILYEMPGSPANYSDTYNAQSAILQRVRNSIRNTYPQTEIGADGQVIQILFADGLIFEVVPAFKNSDGSYTFPDANDGGRWRKTNPISEINAISQGDKLWNSNLIRLCRMARAWKEKWSVPIGGLLIDTLAYNFIATWKHRNESYLYYDWLCRDFFEYLMNQNPDQTYWQAVGSNQFVYRQGSFEYKAKRCYNISLEAIEYQRTEHEWSAKNKWREIYGTAFPS